MFGGQWERGEGGAYLLGNDHEEGESVGDEGEGRGMVMMAGQRTGMMGTYKTGAVGVA